MFLLMNLITYSLGLELVNGLELSVQVVSDRLEALDSLLGLIDDALVLKQLAVMSEIDSGGLLLQLEQNTLGFVIALAEGLEGSSGFLGKAGAQLGPVDLLGGGAKRCHGLICRQRGCIKRRSKILTRQALHPGCR